MGQTINATMKQFNGTDSDNILLTPEPHASSHNVGGSDPITVQTGNLAEDCVTNDKIADNAVGNAQLASNSLTTTKINASESGAGFVVSDIKRKIWVSASQPSGWANGDIWFKTTT